MRADLHVHTRYSDGTLTPAETVAAAAAAGLVALSITDHDTVAGTAEASAAAEGTGVVVVPGVEVSAREGPYDVHILGYFVDTVDSDLVEFLRLLAEGRLARARVILERLAAMDIHLDFDELADRAAAHVLGRPHIAALLAEQGHAATAQEAFRQLLRKGAPAYVEPHTVTPEEAVTAIRRAGGAAVFAHPGLIGLDQCLRGLTECGLCGVEAYHPYHTPDQVERYAAMAAELGLITTGGSDSHGAVGSATRIGQVTCSMEAVEALRLRSRVSPPSGGEDQRAV